MEELVDSPASASDDELTIPRAALLKYIREVCPNTRIGSDTRDLLLQCCSEFIHIVSSEANNICNESQKKTITAEHILKALENLGFGDYVVEAEAVVKDCKDMAAKRRRKNTRLENLGIPEEDLLRQQQQLFNEAKEEQFILDQQRWMQLQQQAAVAEMQKQQQQSGAAGGASSCYDGGSYDDVDDEDEPDDDG